VTRRVWCREWTAAWTAIGQAANTPRLGCLICEHREAVAELRGAMRERELARQIDGERCLDAAREWLRMAWPQDGEDGEWRVRVADGDWNCYAGGDWLSRREALALTSVDDVLRIVQHVRRRLAVLAEAASKKAADERTAAEQARARWDAAHSQIQAELAEAREIGMYSPEARACRDIAYWLVSIATIAAPTSTRQPPMLPALDDHVAMLSRVEA
jgi:hypothetical protein